MIPSYATLSAVVMLTLSGCSGQRPEAAGRPDTATVTAAPARSARPRIVILGTSLTAGYGLPDPALAYPALLQRRIDAAGLKYEVVNRGVSGETSAGARARVDWVLREPAAIVVLETGANDGLRGLEVGSLRANVQAILDRAKRLNPPPKLVLIGMEAPPNYGLDYTRQFRAVYSELARANNAALVPFLLQGVAGIARLNQADGVHPTAEGQRIAAENVWRVLEPLLR
ncbi:MAG: arylesterase [Gemmatimonadota bacterium]